MFFTRSLISQKVTVDLAYLRLCDAVEDDIFLIYTAAGAAAAALLAVLNRAVFTAVPTTD